MRNTIKILVFGLIAFFAVSLSSCRSQRLQTERNFETQTVYVETVRDTTIFTPADSSSLIALFECDSLNNVILKELTQLQGQRSSMSVSTKPIGKQLQIQADCICDSLSIYMQYKDRYLEKNTKETEVVNTESTKKCKLFNAFLWGFGSALLSLLVGLILYNIFKYKIVTWINMILK